MVRRVKRGWIPGVVAAVGCAGRSTPAPRAAVREKAVVLEARPLGPEPSTVQPQPSGTSVPPLEGLEILSQCASDGAEPVVTLLQSSGDDGDHAAIDLPRGFEDAACVTWASVPARRSSRAPTSRRPPSSSPPPPPRPGAPGPIARDQVRIAGDNPRMPSPLVREQMAQQNFRGGDVAVLVCIGADGLFDQATMVPTGFPAFDLDLFNTIGTWRYQPFTIDGVPAPVCSRVVVKIKV